MNRLTRGSEIHNGKIVSYVADVSLYPEMMGYEYEQADMDCVNKLGKLEDLEEELGIDLLTLFKALKDGIYYKNPFTKKIKFAENLVLCKSTTNEFYFSGFGGCLGLKDFNKTWWLEKPKEQEND